MGVIFVDAVETAPVRKDILCPHTSVNPSLDVWIVMGASTNPAPVGTIAILL